jgi:hypothetical protein
LAPDYGINVFRLDDQPIGQSFDAYAPSAAISGLIDLGTHQLSQGTHKLTLEVTGKNTASKDHFAGVDYLELARPAAGGS